MRLGDVAIIKNGMTPSKEEQRSTGFPVLKIKDITASGDFVGMYDSFVDPGLALSLTHKYVDVGDSLILNAAHNADYVGSKICQVTEAFAGSLATGEWMIIRSDATRADRTYIYYWLQFCSSIGLLASLVRGIHLYPKDVGGIEMTLPPIAEQRRIAAILRAADDERRRRRYTQALSDGLLGEVFVRMFGDHRVQHYQLGGLLMESPKNGLYLPADRYGTGTPIIRINNFYDGVLDAPSTYLRVAASKQEVHEFGVVNGEVLINRVNSIEYLGKCALVEGINEPTVFESNMMRLRINCERVVPKYLVTYLSSADAYQQILQRARKAVNQASINQDDVMSLSIPIPSMDLQTHFIAISASIADARRQQQESARQSDHLFDTLLHRAFTGEL